MGNDSGFGAGKVGRIVGAARAFVLCDLGVGAEWAGTVRVEWRPGRVVRGGDGFGDLVVFHPGGKIGAMLRTVGDLMHGLGELPLVGADTPMRDALLVMTEKRWGILGVTDSAGQLAGAITDGDLRRHIDGLMDHKAGEVMTPGPKKTVPPDMLASEALALMSDPAPAVTVLFVVEDARPVGILHVHDILRAGVM